MQVMHVCAVLYDGDLQSKTNRNVVRTKCYTNMIPLWRLRISANDGEHLSFRIL